MGMYESTLLEAYKTKLRRGITVLSRQELVTCVVATFICFHDLYGLTVCFILTRTAIVILCLDGHLGFTG